MKLNIEYLPLSEIKPYAGNAKLHPAEQIEQIKNSIQRFGFNDPIAIWKDEIVEGHGRFIAAQELGIEEVPVIRLDDMSDKERKAYMIAHNKLTMNTGFDNELLKEELNSILDDFDMTDFGFEDYELQGLDGFDEDALNDMFADAPAKEIKPQKFQCPHCGEWFEV